MRKILQRRWPHHSEKCETFFQRKDVRAGVPDKNIGSTGFYYESEEFLIECPTADVLSVYFMKENTNEGMLTLSNSAHLAIFWLIPA